MTCVLRLARAFFVPSFETTPHQPNTALETLNLSHNKVGADGASALAAALQAAFVLSTICLLMSYTVETKIATSMSHSEGSDVRIVAFRFVRALRLSIHHGPMVTYECCNEATQ